MTPVLSILAALLVLPLLWSAVRMPATLRLAGRNVVRRRGEAALVVVGAMLGTAIITASAVTGDVIDASVASGADNSLGPIDVRMSGSGTTTLPTWEADTADLDSPEVDGTLRWVATTGSVVAGDRGDAGVAIASVDLDDARAFGGDVAATGLADVTSLGPDEVVLAQSVADEIGAAAGDVVAIHGFGAERSLTVSAVVERTGLAGYAQVLTAEGTLVEMAGDPAADGLTGQLLLSTTGGVRDAAAPSDQLLDDLRAVAGIEGQAEGDDAGATTTVQPIKQDVLDEAAEVGTEFTTVFGSIGAFAVIAGVLLLVNLFFMLAEERRRDLGTLRALGMRRGLLARTFAAEGAIYATAASVTGVLVGTAVGVGIASVASSIFQIVDGGMTFTPVVEPASLVASGLLGFTISMATAWVLSLRIARANIIRSLRELPEPPAPHRVRTLVLGALGVLAGVAVTLMGISDEAAEPIIAGVPIALLSAVAIARRFVRVELAMAVAGSAAAAWALLATAVWSDVFANAEITVFVVQGVVLTAGTVTLVVAVDRLWKLGADAVTARTGGIAGRLGVAYPLARRSRTALLLAMFSIVVFTMTFISVLDGSFSGQTAQFARDTGGGYELFVTAPRSATDAQAALAGHEDVAAAVPLDRGFVEVVAGDDSEPNLLTSFDESLLAADPPELAARGEGYADDRAVYEAVLADPGLAIVNDGWGEDTLPGGPPSVGDSIMLASPGRTGERVVEVAGVLGGSMVWHGALVSPATAEGLVVPSPDQQFLVDAAAADDAAAIAARLNAELVTAGVDATSVEALVAREVGAQSSFFRLLQVFLGLGLVIGVAGLAVVLVRAVRERTRQVGTLRALGVRRTTVARAFLVEAGFVAVQGVVVGAGLGLVTAWQVLTRTDSFGQLDVPFTVPWVALAVIVAVPLLAALVMTVVPARRAASIRPAVALRVAD